MHNLTRTKVSPKGHNVNEFIQCKRTLRLLASDPLSVVVVTSEVVVDIRVDGATVVECTAQNERKRTALSWNGCGVVTFMKTASQFTPSFV